MREAWHMPRSPPERVFMGVARRCNSPAPLVELGECVGEIRAILDKHGVTRERLLANIPEAKRRAFEQNYPELAAEYGDRAA